MKRILAFLLCAVVFILLPQNAFALNDTYHSAWDDLQCKEWEKEDYSKVNGSINIQKLAELPENWSEWQIESYDVSKDGKIAIAFSNKRIIAVYDKDFTFEYAISFWLNGPYGVLWHGDNIALMNHRGHCAIVINESAEVSKRYDVPGEENDWLAIIKGRTRTWGGYTYLCYDRSESEHKMKISYTAGGRHVLQRTDAEGNVEVLYESEQHVLREALPGILFIMAFIVGVINIYIKLKPLKEDTEQEIPVKDFKAPKY